MTISKIRELLSAELICGEGDLSAEVYTACAAI